MIRTSLVSSLLLFTIGLSAVDAAPFKLNLGEQRTVDRWVEIRDPGQLVGPQIDPSGPLKRFEHGVFAPVLEPEPEPWHKVPQLDGGILGR